MKVLLADDSALVLDRLTEILKVFDRVEIVGSYKNGIHALEGARKLKPDLAILDIKMPGLTGLEVLIEIRREEIPSRCIILTFYTSIYLKQLAIDLGADYFFSKSDDFDKVATVVEEMLEKEETARLNKPAKS